MPCFDSICNPFSGDKSRLALAAGLTPPCSRFSLALGFFSWEGPKEPNCEFLLPSRDIQWCCHTCPALLAALPFPCRGWKCSAGEFSALSQFQPWAGLWISTVMKFYSLTLNRHSSWFLRYTHTFKGALHSETNHSICPQSVCGQWGTCMHCLNSKPSPQPSLFIRNPRNTYATRISTEFTKISKISTVFQSFASSREPFLEFYLQTLQQRSIFIRNSLSW